MSSVPCTNSSELSAMRPFPLDVEGSVARAPLMCQGEHRLMTCTGCQTSYPVETCSRESREARVDIVTIDQQGEKVRLDSISAAPPKKTDRDEAKRELDELGEELFELQDLLWVARMNSVLIVLQGRDTAGKDGTI